MEFAWNTKKNKITDIKGLEKEQDREGKISNKKIDLNKTHLNYDLVQSKLNLYQRIKQRVDEVRPFSRIQKNSVVNYSNIITVPKEQFKKWGVDKSKEYLKHVYDYFCKEFGKENVLSAKVHLDETTPHMHLHFAPVSHESKLQARKVMTPHRINKIHSEAPKYLQERGFDVVRGQGKTEKSLEINEFKAEKVKEQLKCLENDLNSLSKTVEHSKLMLDKLDRIEAKRTPFGAYKISTEDYSTLLNLAREGQSKILENTKLKAKVGALEEDNQKIEYKYNRISSDNTKITKENIKLKRDNVRLKNAFNKVEKAVQNLGMVDQVNNEIKSMTPSKSKSFDMER